MAISQSMCTSFKAEILEALHNFNSPGGDTFYMALYTSMATLSAATTVYSSADEAVGTGYVAGGIALTVAVSPTTSGTSAYMSFNNASWTSSTISASGALIYNATNGNRAVAVLNFGGTVSDTAGTFTVVMPTAAPGTAIIQVI